MRNEDDESEVCHVCKGTGLNKTKTRTQKEWEEEGCPYDQIQCPHCNGTGYEPD